LNMDGHGLDMDMYMDVYMVKMDMDVYMYTGERVHVYDFGMDVYMVDIYWTYAGHIMDILLP